MNFANHIISCSRRTPTEDDGIDHIDSDTPRSGINTPKPDPSDKRLPGIMHSYFQVGPNLTSSEVPVSVALESPAPGSVGQTPPVYHQRESTDLPVPLSQNQRASSEVSNCDSDFEVPLLPHEQTSRRDTGAHSSASVPYPTPPESKPPSLRALEVNEPTVEKRDSIVKNPSSYCASPKTPPANPKKISDSLPSKAGRAASLWKTLSSIVTPSNVHARHFSNPSEPETPKNTQRSPVLSRTAPVAPSESLSHASLRELTIGNVKSHPPTPTRALSNNTSASDNTARSNSDNQSRAATGREHTPKALSPEANGAPVRAPRGKLTVKIVEARGLRRCRDPYVVAVFQRNELVSKGPQHDDHEEDNEEAASSPPIGGIPISRQGSDSGRTMAIPMRSRQSSSTSLTEQRDFKKSRKLITEPKWDTEAVL